MVGIEFTYVCDEVANIFMFKMYKLKGKAKCSLFWVVYEISLHFSVHHPLGHFLYVCAS